MLKSGGYCQHSNWQNVSLPPVKPLACLWEIFYIVLDEVTRNIDCCDTSLWLESWTVWMEKENYVPSLLLFPWLWLLHDQQLWAPESLDSDNKMEFIFESYFMAVIGRETMKHYTMVERFGSRSMSQLIIFQWLEIKTDESWISALPLLLTLSIQSFSYHLTQSKISSQIFGEIWQLDDFKTYQDNDQPW